MNPMSSNPYHNQTFFGFILEFFSRIWQLVSGQLNVNQLASDEIQILVLTGVAASAALVGSILVLRKMTMLANSLSHTILIGIVLAFFFTMTTKDGQHGNSVAPMEILLVAAMATGFLTAFLTEFLIKIGHLQEDASIGLIFTTFFALGVILVTLLTKDAHIGLEAVMGNADALHIDDALWVYIVLITNIIIFTLFYKEFQLTTFDAGLAAALGLSPIFFNYLLMAQVSSTAITSFRAVGVIMVLALITGPPLIARLFTNRLSTYLISSSLIGALAAFIGVALSRHLLTVYGAALTTSGIVVCVIILFYLIALSTKWVLKTYQNKKRGEG